MICRACKSYAGKAINYITEKKKAERITTHGLDESRSMAQQFIDTAMLHGKGDTYEERKYYHIKISFEPKDRIENGGKLNAELAEKIADEYFKKQYGNHEYILAIHTDKGHIHCHAIINAVNFENGKKIQHSNKDLANMKDQVNEIAERHGVSRFDWKQAVKEKRQRIKDERDSNPKELTQAEKYIQERHGVEWSANSWKETLRGKIDEAKGQSINRAEFQKYLLENYGIEMPRNTAKTVSFKHPAVDETVRGAKLGAEYTAESIDKALNQNHERSVKYANELRAIEKRTDYTARTADTHRARHDTGANNESNIGDTVSANEPIRGRADESGERRTKTDVSELWEKLQQIRGLDDKFNPAEQRRAAREIREKSERDRKEKQSNERKLREEVERTKNEQQYVERKYNSHNDEHDR